MHPIQNLYRQIFSKPDPTAPSKPIPTDKAELIAVRAVRVCNRKQSLVKQYNAVHAAFLGGDTE